MNFCLAISALFLYSMPTVLVPNELQNKQKKT